jgi:Transposase, Mutator family
VDARPEGGRGVPFPIDQRKEAGGDGALGFWAAPREVFPEARQGRCWVHKVVNILHCLPKSAQPAARKALAQIRDAEDREHAELQRPGACAVRGDHHGIELLVPCVSVSMSLNWYTCRGGVANVA